jgi:hypothetical protein
VLPRERWLKAIVATALAVVGVMVGIFVLFTWGIGDTKQPVERQQEQPVEREQERAVAAAQHIALSCGWTFGHESINPEIAFSRCRVDDLDRLEEAVWLVRFTRIGRPRRSACVGVDLRRFRVLDVDGRLLAADSGGPEPPLPGEGRWRASCPQAARNGYVDERT